MTKIIDNISAFAEAGFQFPDHTVYIWSAYGISAFVLMGLVVWTLIQSRNQTKIVKSK